MNSEEFEKPKALHGRVLQEDRYNLKLPKISNRLTSPSYVKNATSGKPEAVVKITSFARGASVKKLMEYIARTNDKETDDIVLEDENGTQIKNKEEIKKTFDTWSEDFQRAKRRTPEQLAAAKKYEADLDKWKNAEKGKKGKKPRAPKGAGRDGTHIILHALAANDPKTGMKVEEAARKALRELYGNKGQEYVFALHQDKKDPHVHVVMKNHNNQTNKKLRMGKEEIFQLRQAFAQNLQELGIEQVATLRRDRPKTMEKVAKGIEPMRNNDSWFRAKTVTPTLQQQVKGIRTIGTLVKNAKLPAKDKTALKAAFRELEKELINNPDQASQIIEKSTKSMGGLAKHVQAGINKIASIKAPDSPPTIEVKKKRVKGLAVFAQRYLKEINGAISTTTKSKLPELDKKKALFELKKIKKTYEKHFTKTKER